MPEGTHQRFFVDFVGMEAGEFSILVFRSLFATFLRDGEFREVDRDRGGPPELVLRLERLGHVIVQAKTAGGFEVDEEQPDPG